MQHDGLDLAVRDYGGSGPPILLIHGAGQTLADWSAMATHLTERHRVVAMDLRNHGRSGSGPWTWDAALGDVAAVVDHFRLERPAVVGHSLGGMLAAIYGERVADCRAAVNLDGHGLGTPDQYPGLDPHVVRERQQQIIDAALAPLAAEMGRTADGGLVAIEEGILVSRPSADSWSEILTKVRELDLVALYRRVRCPLLIYRTELLTDPVPNEEESPEPWMGEMTAAYRKGLRRDLANLEVEHQHVTVQTVDATHMLILELPGRLAEEISTFVLTGSLRD